MAENTKAAGGGSSHRAAVGSLIAVYALVDAYVLGISVVVLSALFNPLIVWAVAAVAISMINFWACSWLDREWDFWIAGPGRRLEKKLEKLRSGKRLKRPVGWVQSGSDFWFTLAAVVINAITVVGLVRLIGGVPVGRHRVLLAALGYSIFFATLFSLIGLGIHDVT